LSDWGGGGGALNELFVFADEKLYAVEKCLLTRLKSRNVPNALKAGQASTAHTQPQASVVLSTGQVEEAHLDAMAADAALDPDRTEEDLTLMTSATKEQSTSTTTATTTTTTTTASVVSTRSTAAETAPSLVRSAFQWLVEGVRVVRCSQFVLSTCH
jgi:hypothetical protein